MKEPFIISPASTTFNHSECNMNFNSSIVSIIIDILSYLLIVQYIISVNVFAKPFNSPNYPKPPDLSSSSVHNYSPDNDADHSSTFSQSNVHLSDNINHTTISTPLEVNKIAAKSKPSSVKSVYLQENKYDDDMDNQHHHPNHPDDGELDLSESIEYSKVTTKIGSNKDKVLLIMLDGLRSDLIDKNNRLKAFKFISENGVKSKVKPVYPSLNYPNLYSMATGLYPNKHQLIANNMYSTKHDELFSSTSSNYHHHHWWNRAEPIWIRAARRGKRVAAYWIPGADIELFGVKLNHVEAYQDMVGNRNYDRMFSERLTSMVSAFRKNRLDLGMIRYEKIDAIGQLYGHESREIKKVIVTLNKMLNQLIDETQDLLNDILTIYIVSNHGIGPVMKQIFLEDYVDFNDIKLMVGEGAFSMLLPETGKEAFIRKQLKEASVDGLNIYSSGRLPIHFHLDRAENLLPIILTADPGYTIVKSPLRDGYVSALHGWDAEFDDNMLASMYAVGPYFKRNFTLRNVNMIDHYNLLCHILGIIPRENDGDWPKMDKSLKPPTGEAYFEDDYRNEEYADYFYSSTEAIKMSYLLWINLFAILTFLLII